MKEETIMLTAKDNLNDGINTQPIFENSSDDEDVYIEEVDGSDDYTSQEEVQYLKKTTKNTAQCSRRDLRSANSDSRKKARINSSK